MIVLITPTGGRPDQIRLCAEFMNDQDYQGDVLWIVVDDCLPRTTDFLMDDFGRDWEIAFVYPDPPWKQGDNTQGRNIGEAIKLIRHVVEDNDVEGIFIIEDDDYYSPGYLTSMLRHLKGYDLAGETHTIYYTVKYRGWFMNQNAQHSSLFQIAFTPKVIDDLESVLHYKYIDIYFCQSVQNKNLFRDGNLAVGIKGLPGRGGIGNGHGNLTSYEKDYDLKQLIKFIGKHAASYVKYCVHL